MRIRQDGTSFLSDIVSATRDGRLVPAAFQRPYVWGPDDVEALFESLISGWPTGTLLVWNPDRETDLAASGRYRIGPIAVTPAPGSGMILDGQNRLATLAWSFHSPGAPLPPNAELSAEEIATWRSGRALVADFDTRPVRFVPEAEANHGYRTPASALLDSTILNRKLLKMYETAGGVPDEVILLLDNAATNIREARMLKTVIDDATPAEAVHAFSRLARTGQPMLPEDLERALGWLGGEAASLRR